MCWCICLCISSPAVFNARWPRWMKMLSMLNQLDVIGRNEMHWSKIESSVSLAPSFRLENLDRVGWSDVGWKHLVISKFLMINGSNTHKWERRGVVVIVLIVKDKMFWNSKSIYIYIYIYKITNTNSRMGYFTIHKYKKIHLRWHFE